MMMKMNHAWIMMGMFVLVCTACNRNCNCEETWVNDQDRIYTAGDQIEHEGICYEAVAQCRASACEPGSDSDDVFVVCVD
jgi:hypothetical protein